MTIQVRTDRGMSIERLIKEGHFCDDEEGCFLQTMSFISTIGRERPASLDLEMHLLDNKRGTPRDAMAYMRRNNMRPANVWDLLSLHRKHLRLVQSFPMIAFGSPAKRFTSERGEESVYPYIAKGVPWGTNSPNPDIAFFLFGSFEKGWSKEAMILAVTNVFE